jgi:NTP pyrophosphatase (non-canonical NTP hydrolase)
MTFADYQIEARKTAIYPNVGSNYIYPVLGLCGEAGEVAEKVKKIIRDKDGKVSDEDRKAIAKELGDGLWYLSNLCCEFGLTLDQIAVQNINKLRDRKNRDKLHGSGDNR